MLWHIIKAETFCTLDKEDCPYKLGIDGFVIHISVSRIRTGCLTRRLLHSFFTGEGERAALPATINVEEACARAGGICLPEKECPTDHLSPKRGLCPSQQEAGVECCHGRTFETRFESFFNQNFMDCKMLQTKSDNENISRNY